MRIVPRRPVHGDEDPDLGRRAGVGRGVGSGVGSGVGRGVGLGVGRGVGAGVGTGQMVGQAWSTAVIDPGQGQPPGSSEQSSVQPGTRQSAKVLQFPCSGVSPGGQTVVTVKKRSPFVLGVKSIQRKGQKIASTKSPETGSCKNS